MNSILRRRVADQTGSVRSLSLTALALAVGSAVAMPALASTTAGTEAEAERLNPVMITASLYAQSADETLASVTVIDREAIERRQPREFHELLRGQAGMDVVSNGSFGKSTSVFTRGTAANSTVLLVDGIRLRSATSGAPSWQYLPTAMIDRVEIVRGPRGGLYGADAVGGVVQVMTRQGQDGDRHWLKLGGGTFDSRDVSGGLSGQEGRTRYAFSAGHFATDGTALIRGGEDKAYRNSSGLASLAHTLDSGAELSAVALRTEGKTFYEGGYQEFVNQAAGVKALLPVGERWQSSLQLSESRDDSDVQDSNPGVFETRSRSARLENTVLLGDHHTLVFGGDYLEDRITTTNRYGETSRDNVGAFGQLTLGLGQTTVQGSLRWDDNEAFGEEVTGGLALGQRLGEDTTARLVYSRSFRAPTFNDLYYPSDGNPDLRPEKADMVEVGVRVQKDVLFWDLAAYQQDIDDLINWAPDAPGSHRWTPMNVDRARIRGAELQVGADLNGWLMQVAGTFTDARDDRTDKFLQRRARQGLRVDLDRDLTERWSAGASVLAQSHRYEDARNTRRLAGYGQLDLRVAWQFHPRWTARLSMENVFDKEYETAGNYINAGRYTFLSLQYQSR